MVFYNDKQKKTKLAGLYVNMTEQFNFKSHKNMSSFELFFMFLKTYLLHRRNIQIALQ